MKNITLIDKSSHNITSQFDGNKIINLTSKPTVIVLKHEIEIFEIKQENNQIVIALTNGEKIIVEGFFDADHSLVVQGSDQQLIWVQFTDQRGALLAEINYQPLEEIEPLLYKDGAVLPWLWPVVTAGGILAWAADGSSKDSKKTDSVPPDNGNGENNTGGDNNTGGAGGDLINGKDGLTPYIGENGNWFIGETDTGIKAEGEAGQSAYDIYREQAENKVLIDTGLNDKDTWLAENEGKTEADFQQTQEDAITTAEDKNEILDQAEWLESLKNGPQGEKGEAGQNGANGQSAYEIYKSETELSGKVALGQADWLASLQGKDGAAGQSAYQLYEAQAKEKGETVLSLSDWLNSLVGKPGTNGTNGKNGTDGINGQSAYEIYKADAEDKGETVKNVSDWLLGLAGKNGASAYEIYKSETELSGKVALGQADWLASLQGKDGAAGQSAYQLYEAQAKEKGETVLSLSDWLNSLVGKPGTNGTNGINGQSAYEIYKADAESKGETVKNVSDWLLGLAGKNGASAYEIYKSETELSGKVALGQADWLASLQGEDGAAGQSAYQLYEAQAKEKGETVLSLSDWLNSLVGKPGTNGTNGKNGTDGINGQSAYEIYKADAEDKGETVKNVSDWLLGLAGKNGASAYEIYKSETELSGKVALGQADWLASLQGEDGAAGQSAYQLYEAQAKEKGETVLSLSDWLNSLVGKPGTNGTNGINGQSAYEIYKADAESKGETVKNVSDWLLGLAGKNGASAYEIYKSETELSGKVALGQADWLASLQGEDGAAGQSAYQLYEAQAKEKGETVLSLSDWLNSLVGKPGTNGINGQSAYEIYKADAESKGETVKNVSDWLLGLAGKNGASAYEIYKSETELSGKVALGQADWLASLQGEDGAAGQSAYQLYEAQAKEKGETVLSLSDWLNSLVGKPGTNGTNGTNGINGQSAYEIYKADAESKGETVKNVSDWLLGLAGKNGASAYEIYKSETELSGKVALGQADWLASLQGKDGAAGQSAYQLYEAQAKEKGETVLSLSDWLNSLVGKPGTNGTNGTNGINGQSAYEIYKADAESKGETVKNVSDWLLGLAGKNGASAYEIYKSETELSGKVALGQADWLASLQGKDGAAGQSAYQLYEAQAKEKGETVLSLSDWLNSLVGKPGTNGTNGINGQSAYEIYKADAEDKGETVKNVSDWLLGLAGKNGASAYEIYKSETELSGKVALGQADWLASLQGEDGAAGQSAYQLYEAQAKEKGETVLSLSDWLNSLVGKPGTNGTNGINGQSAYEIYKADAESKGETVKNVSDWLLGLAGKNGASAYEIYKSETELSGKVALGQADWLASLQGEDGAAGQSAYQLYEAQAKEKGETVLSLSDWLNSLVGKPGTNGTNGINGQSAYEIYKADAESKGETVKNVSDWLLGLAGKNGASAYEIYKSETELSGKVALGQADWLASLQGKDGKSAYELYLEDNDADQATWSQSAAATQAYADYVKAQEETGLTPVSKETWLESTAGKAAYNNYLTSQGVFETEEKWLDSLQGANGEDGASGSADLVTKVHLLNDLDGNGKIDAKELSENSTISIKIDLGKDAQAGDIIKANGIERELTDADISEKSVTINDVPVLDGFNFIKVDAQNAQKQTDVEFTFFDVDSSVIGTERDIVESLTFLNDINEDGSLNAAEMGGKFYTSLKVTLGEDAKAGDIVSVNGDRYVLTAVEVQAKTLNVYMPVREGLNPVQVTATDEWGNIDSVSSSIIVGTLAPSEPMTAPEAWDNVESIVGPIKSNGKTNDNQPEIKGSGRVEGEIITLTINGEVVVTDEPIIVGRDGTWSYTPTQPLNDAEYVVSYTVSNSNGVTQGSSPELKFTVDTQTASQDAVIRITEIEGEALFIEDQKQTIVVNESQQKDGKIKIQGDVSGIATSAGDALKEVVVSIINKGVTQQVTVVADDDGKWTADVSTTGLQLEHGDKPSVQAIAVIVDDAGNTLEVPVTEGFTLDIQVLDPASDLDGLHVITEVEGTDFKVDASEVEDGYVTVKGQIAALPSDVNVADLTVSILINGNVVERQIDLTALNQNQAKDGFIWTKDASGNINWSLDFNVSEISLVDGIANVNAVAGLKDLEGNTLDLTASKDFNIELGLTEPDEVELNTGVGEYTSEGDATNFTFAGLLGNIGGISLEGEDQAAVEGSISTVEPSEPSEPSAQRIITFSAGATVDEPIKVKSAAIGEIRAEFTNVGLLTVAKGYGIQLQKWSEASQKWQVVMSAPLNGNGVVASLGTQYALGSVKNKNYEVTFSGLTEGDYRVVPYKSDSVLTEAIKDIRLGALGDGGLLGENNQEVILDLVAKILDPDSPSTAGLIKLLEDTLEVLNVLTLPVSRLLHEILNLPVIKDVVGLVDRIVDEVVAQLVSNTLTLLNESKLSVEFNSYFYEDSERSGNVLENDFNKVLDELSIVDVSNQLGQVYQFTSEDKTEFVQLVGQHGILTIAQDGSYTYKLNPSAHAKDAQGNLIGKTDVFTYTATNGKLTHQNTLTIDINGGAATEVVAYDDVNHLTLAVDPSVESQPLVSKSIFNVAYVGLGSVLDLGAINPANRFEINVAENTERLITFKAETGGVQVLADFDLFIYKYDEVTKQYKLDDQVEGWFGAALLGGVSEELTKKLDAGQYIVLLEPSRGINALFGYTLETTRDLLLDYVKPISVAGQATGNVINDVNKDSKVDFGPNMEMTYVISAKSITGEDPKLVMIQDDQSLVGTEVKGKYGTLTLFSNGEYTYTALETKNFNYGDIDRFEYTIYDPILGQVSQANLDIKLNLHDVELDVDTVIAHMNIKASELAVDFSKTYKETDPEAIAKQELLGNAKPSATSFGVAGVGLGNVLDASIIGSSNAISLNVGAGKVIETVFSATGTSAVGVAAISDFAIYKLNEKTNQWELYHFQDQFLTVPLSLLGIPLGGIHNDPLTLALTEGQYKAFLTDRGVKVIGGSTLKLDSALVTDYYKPNQIENGYEYEAITEGHLVELEADQIEMIQVDGQKFTGESLDIKGEFGTLTVAKDGSYTYTADTTSQKPNYGAIDTFTYVYKDLLTGETAVSAINVKTGSVDAQRDVLDINGQPSSTKAGMILRHDDFVDQKVVYKDDLYAPAKNEVKETAIEFTIAPHSQYSTNSLYFKFDAKAQVSLPSYDVKISYDLILLTTDEQGNQVREVVRTDVSTEKGGTSLEFTATDLKSGYYILEMKVQGVVGSRIDYQYEIKGTQDYQDRWMADPNYSYADEANVVKGNLLDNDIFSKGLKDQTILKVGNKVLSLDPVVGAKTITVEGLYGTFVIDKSGTYTYTPNGQGGGREIMTYELISPTGEKDKSTIEIDVSKIVKGSNVDEYIYSDSANDVYSLGNGSDTVIFDLLNQHDNVGGNGHDKWTDFHVGTDLNADKIDISALLPEKGILDQADLNKFVSVDVKDGNTIISIDRDGETIRDESGKAISGDQYAMTELLTLSNVQKNLDELLENKQLLF